MSQGKSWMCFYYITTYNTEGKKYSKVDIARDSLNSCTV